MVNVHNWIDSGKCPDRANANDMRFGIGCMNDLLMELTEKMADLLHNVGEFTSYDASDLLRTFEASTFGHQMGILKSRYNGADISYSKMEQLLGERNYFIHDYRTDAHSSSDPKRLFDLIHLIQNLIGQLDNANQRVGKQNKVKQNKRTDNLRKSIIKAVNNCSVWYDEYVKLSDVGIYLDRMGCGYEGKLGGLVEGYGWTIYYGKDHENVKYLKISEIC